MDKIIDPNIAINAYNSALRNDRVVRGEDKSGESDSAGDSGGVTFSDFLREKAEDSVDTLRKSEEMSAKAVTGDADITDVVQAVTNAEVTLQTVVSIRDRMISAYQEILRMPI